MAQLKIETLDNCTIFSPGSEIAGIAGWEVDSIKSATIRLIWRTEGKGTQDVGLASEQVFDNPDATDAQPFRFAVPAGPISYDGKLLAIVWSLELEVQRGKHIERMDITILPTSESIAS